MKLSQISNIDKYLLERTNVSCALNESAAKGRTGKEVAGISAASTSPQIPSVEVLRSLSELMTWFGGPKTMGGQRVVREKEGLLALTKSNAASSATFFDAQ